MKLREIITLTVVVSVMGALGVKALQYADETADVIACRANLAVLANGVIQYEEAIGHLPPLYVFNATYLPGWNLRLLPYIGHSAVHAELVDNFFYLYTPIPAGTVREQGRYDIVFDSLASVSEWRCAQRQPEAMIKRECGEGPTTDYATPLIFTNFWERNVTLTFSSFHKESPLRPYELNIHKNTWWQTRGSEEWTSGKTNSVLISEKYIPDWAVTEDSSDCMRRAKICIPMRKKRSPILRLLK